MDIGAWLRGLGLGQYGATFRENKIDAEVLLELTDTDLGKIGVPLGYRKCLLSFASSETGPRYAKGVGADPLICKRVDRATNFATKVDLVTAQYPVEEGAEIAELLRILAAKPEAPDVRL